MFPPASCLRTAFRLRCSCVPRSRPECLRICITTRERMQILNCAHLAVFPALDRFRIILTLNLPGLRLRSESLPLKLPG
jgi:hypothetical protein